jgi:hypothetical protein
MHTCTIISTQQSYMHTNLNTFNSVVLECNVTLLRNTVQVKIFLRLANLSYVKAFPFGSTFQNNIPKITWIDISKQHP